LGGIEP